MARTKIEWNLSELGGKGLISTTEKVVKVKTKVDGEEKTLEGNCTFIGRIVNLPLSITALEAAINKGKKDDKDKVKLTHEYLLAEFVNSAIETNYKQYLRVKANPAKAVSDAIKRLKTQFPNMPEEHLKAMAEMMLASMTVTA